MKKAMMLLFFAFSMLNSFSQLRRDAVWCFGDSAQIDFNQVPPEISSCSVRSRGTCCSITDSVGNLVFYCHTAYIPLWSIGYDKLGVVWNKNNQVMENGDSLIGDGWYHEMVICPSPNLQSTYFLFQTDVSLNPGIYYSMVDMNLNNGLGRIIQKNVLLDSLNGAFVTDGLTAIKHGNGRDWWLLFRTFTFGASSSNTFYKYLLTPFGITKFTQNIGVSTTAGFLTLKFNNVGNKLLVHDVLGLLEIFDFDRCSGQLSNAILIHSENSNPADHYFSAEFSENDSILYVASENTTSYLYQYDLTSTNIGSSRITIDAINYPIYAAGNLKLAPDGKIYFSRTWYDGVSFSFPYADTTFNIYNTYLSVVNSPNTIGSGCDFQPYSFYLDGRRTYVGLPNNPNYDMMALGGSVCDTLGLPNQISNSTSELISQFSVFYHSGWQTTYINASGLQGRNYAMFILNMEGKEIFKETGSLVSGYYTKNYHCEFLSSGTYIVFLETEKDRLVKKFVKE